MYKGFQTKIMNFSHSAFPSGKYFRRTEENSYLAKNFTVSVMEKHASPLVWRRLEGPEDPCFAEAWRIYDASFPRCEKRSREHLVQALADPLFLPQVVLSGERVAAVVFCWRTPGGLYLEHLAVDPGLRNEKLGSRLASGGQPVVLEIEPPADELTRRRCGFYRRNGFVANEHPYLHPSYSRPFEPHPLVLMSRPEPLTGAQAESFGKFVRETVLRYSDHGPVPEK